MLERVKWLTVMIAIATLFMGAQVAAERFIGLSTRVVEPTATPTLIPSATTAPTKTSSPIKTAATTHKVFISEIVNDPHNSDLAGEYVLIENPLSNPINLAGWTLRDDQKNIYTFPAYLLGSGRAIKVWTRTGVNTTNNLYWNSDSEVWNAGGDCGYLRDADGDLRSYICY